MSKINWKKIAFDAIKAAIAVVVGALMGSCTVRHFSITSVSVPDSCFIHSVDNSINSLSNFGDSIFHMYESSK